MIEVQNITKYYGQVRALNNISFSVDQGQIVGLLGPNGSGKTTLMRILTGFFPPTSGHVRIGGLDVAESPIKIRNRLGYLPENVVLYPDLSVRSFLQFCARVKLDSAAERKSNIARVLHQCSLEHMAKRQIGTLSKGYRQRVGLAQSLLGNPQVLILDEPTVGLDPHQVIDMRELIKGLAGEATVLLSSHILSEVGLTCDRVVIIDKGNIIAEDTTEHLGERVQGTTQTFVRIGGPQPDLLPALQALNGVTEVIAQPKESNDDEGEAFVILSLDRSVAREIAEAVVSHGWDLYELRRVTMSLEELFVRLTVEQQDAAA